MLSYSAALLSCSLSLFSYWSALLASGLATVRSMGLEVSVAGRHSSSALLMGTGDGRGPARGPACSMGRGGLLAREKSRELARKGFPARRGDRR